jgi:hypothetical protein
MIHFGRRSLYNILIEFCILHETRKANKIRPAETNSRVRVYKNLSDMILIRNGLKRRICFIAIAFQVRFIVRHWDGSGKRYKSASGLC